MKLLRNPEVRRELRAFMILTLLFAGAGFLLSPRFALPALAFGAAFTLLALFFIRRRYRAMAALAERMDQILHGQEQTLTDHSEEGEISILSAEAQKMTVRLREQAGQLAAEKLRLTEAIQDIFHQIRTPLTSMNLTVSLLREEELPLEHRLQLTRELKRQLEVPAEIVCCPIVREANGLAMSSRNRRLTPHQFETAAQIHRILEESKQQPDVPQIKQFVEEEIAKIPEFKLDYFEMADDQMLQSVQSLDDAEGVMGFITVYVGDVRLIDNIRYR